MNRRTEIQSELKTLSKTVAELPTKQPFQLPDGYFDNFGAGLRQKLEEEPMAQKTVPVVRLWARKTILRYAVAACITGVLGWVLHILSAPNPEIQDTALVKLQNSAQLSEEAIAQYFIGIDDWISEPEQAETFIDNNLLVDIDRESISTLLSGITEQGIHQYLEQLGTNPTMTYFF